MFFNERIAEAEEILIQAAQLNEKCSFWYEAMQTVALAQGWDESQEQSFCLHGLFRR